MKIDIISKDSDFAQEIQTLLQQTVPPEVGLNMWEHSSRLPHQPESNHVYIFYAGLDVSLLLQQVYDLYLMDSNSIGLPIICILEPEAIQQNPSLFSWLIRGRAAVLTVLARNELMKGYLHSWVNRLTKMSKVNGGL